MTARHVVDGCETVGLAFGSGRRLLPVSDIRTSPDSDIALLIHTPRATDVEIHKQDTICVWAKQGFHVGYPQGQPGEVTSRLLSRSRLITRGRYRNEEPVSCMGGDGTYTRTEWDTWPASAAGLYLTAKGGLWASRSLKARAGAGFIQQRPILSAAYLRRTNWKAVSGRAFQIDLSTYGREADRSAARIVGCQSDLPRRQ